MHIGGETGLEQPIAVSVANCTPTYTLIIVKTQKFKTFLKLFIVGV